jgi:hypothetical protein
MMVVSPSYHFLFGFYPKKKVIKPVFLKKKTKIGSNRPVLVWFGYFRKNTGSNGLARFFLVWLGFFQFDSVFSGFFFDLGSVRFFQFHAYKTETEPNRSFFLNSNRVFFTVWFFQLFFFRFS